MTQKTPTAVDGAPASNVVSLDTRLDGMTLLKRAAVSRLRQIRDRNEVEREVDGPVAPLGQNVVSLADHRNARLEANMDPLTLLALECEAAARELERFDEPA